MARLGSAWQGEAGHGEVRRGWAQLGMARRGRAWHGQAWQCVALRGWARHGKAGQFEARQGRVFMKYYSVNFRYSYDSEYANEVTAAVDMWSEAFLLGAGLQYIHEYTYPDGSCYKIVRCDLSRLDLHTRLSGLIEAAHKHIPHRIGIGSIKDTSPDDKRGARTVRDIFEDFYDFEARHGGARPG